MNNITTETSQISCVSEMTLGVYIANMIYTIIVYMGIFAFGYTFNGFITLYRNANKISSLEWFWNMFTSFFTATRFARYSNILENMIEIMSNPEVMSTFTTILNNGGNIQFDGMTFVTSQDSQPGMPPQASRPPVFVANPDGTTGSIGQEINQDNASNEASESENDDIQEPENEIENAVSLIGDEVVNVINAAITEEISGIIRYNE